MTQSRAVGSVRSGLRLVVMVAAATVMLPSLASAGSSSFVSTGPTRGIRLCYFGGSNSPGGTEHPATCRGTHHLKDMTTVVHELNTMGDGA